MFSLRIVLLVSASALCFPSISVQADEQKPNILFIFADDQCYDTIHGLGNEEIQTPNLDRLARSGRVFRRTYNQGGWNGAICIASRTMLNTGRYLWHAKAEENRLKKDAVDKREFWSQMMADGGYQTFFTGKWHVRAGNGDVFEVSRHVRGGMPKQTDAGYHRPPADGSEDPWKPWDKSRGGFWEGGVHWSEVVADDTVDYLNMAADDPRPFFMYIAFNAPHDPRQAPKSFVDRYPADTLKVPTSFLPEYPYDIGASRIRDEILAPFPRTEHAVQVHRQEYYAIITHMDEQIGRILNRLEETGQADNTWIFFTADHGLAVGHHGLIGKQNQFDHSIRVPFFVSGPGVDAGTESEAPIYLQSVMPTILEVADIPVPQQVEFDSILPLIRGESDESPLEEQGVYNGYIDVQRSLTWDGHKLILYPKIGVHLLFDMNEDPQELTDLASEDGQSGRIAELFRRLLIWQERTGDSLDLESAFPELANAL